MANGIKLRRGLQTALTGTIAEGELVMATDTGKLGLKKGATEHFVDLPTLVDAVSALQPQPIPGLLEVEYNKDFYFDADDSIELFGNILVPICRLNPLVIDEGNLQGLVQVINIQLDYQVVVLNSELLLEYSYENSKSSNSDSISSLFIMLADSGYGLEITGSNISIGENSFTCRITMDENFNIHLRLPETRRGSTKIISVRLKANLFSRSIRPKNTSEDIFIFLPPLTNTVIFEDLKG